MHEPIARPADATAEPGMPLGRAAAAELLASFTAVLFAAGSVVVGGSVGSGLVGSALATGFAFGVALTATMPLSGGGVNPVLAVGLWVAGKLSTRRAVVYVAAQLAGGVLAGVMLRVAIPGALAKPTALGTPLLAEGVGSGSAVLVEAVAAFVLTTMAFAMLVDDRSRSAAYGGLLIGLLVAAATLLAWPLTGAALNPARALGPEIASGVWRDWWVYWVGPLAGAVVGGVASWALLLRDASEHASGHA